MNVPPNLSSIKQNIGESVSGAMQETKGVLNSAKGVLESAGKSAIHTASKNKSAVGFVVIPGGLGLGALAVQLVARNAAAKVMSQVLQKFTDAFSKTSAESKEKTTVSTERLSEESKTIEKEDVPIKTGKKTRNRIRVDTSACR